MERYYLPHSTTCFVCGQENNIGLKCRFFADENGSVHLEPKIKADYAGFAKVVHGGIQTAIMDEAMGWCAFTQHSSENLCFTRELNMKFRRNVVPMSNILLTANLVDVKRNFYYVEGKIEDDSGAVLTQANGIFIPIPSDIMAQIKNELYYINDGRKYLEKAIRVCNPKPVSI